MWNGLILSSGRIPERGLGVRVLDLKEAMMFIMLKASYMLPVCVCVYWYT